MYKIIGADGREYGPVSLETLRQWTTEGRANNDTRVLAAGATEWKRLGDLPEFAPPGTGTPAAPSIPRPIGPPPQAARTNSLAIAGLVFGIISITFGLCCYGLPFNLAGIACSAVALNQINKDPQHEGGRGLAVAGLVLSILSLLLASLLLGLYFSFGPWRFSHRWYRL